MAGLDIALAGEQFVLLPERAVYWPRQHLLMLADVHFGKDTHLQRSGISVPAIADQQDMLRLCRLLEQTQAKTLVILGDLFHAKPSGQEAAIKLWQPLCEQFPATDIVAVKGNHDKQGAIQQLPLQWIDELQIGTIRFSHEPPASKPASYYTFCGHLHPCYRLQRGRKERVRLPVYWIKPHYCVLPAFGLLTGGMNIEPKPEDRLALITPEGVFPGYG